MPAGGYLTTVDDLARFEGALMDGELVIPKTLQRMLTPSVLPDREHAPYGLGWAMELEPWHGDICAFQSGSSPAPADGRAGAEALIRRRHPVALGLSG